MKNKIIVIFIVMLLSISGMHLVFDDVNVIADPGEGEGVGLDFQMIHEITEDLSLIVIDLYDEETGELAKGRAFGSKGEKWAANYLNDSFNDDIGIDSFMDPIESMTSPYFMYNTLSLMDFNDGLQVNDREIDVNGPDGLPDIDCYISPHWGFTSLEGCSLTETIEPGCWLDTNFTVYDKTDLTEDISLSNLKIYDQPTNYRWLKGPLIKIWDLIINFEGLTPQDLITRLLHFLILIEETIK